MKKLLIALVIIIVLGGGIYIFMKSSRTPVLPPQEAAPAATSTVPQSTVPSEENAPEVVIGTSTENRAITAYNFGTGASDVVFVGGIHGGYAWNSSLLAYQLMDYLKQNPSAIPANMRVTVIPSLNPDGLAKVTSTAGEFSPSSISASAGDLVAGRFNGRNVDLNRNFDCDWQASATWQNKAESAGESAFSEPESQAIKNYIAANNPVAVVSFDSSAGAVYASSCDGKVSAETDLIAKAYAEASGYSLQEDFNSYEVTGDMTDWLAKNNIPAINVLLANHTDTDWDKNKAGIEAILNHYANS